MTKILLKTLSFVSTVLLLVLTACGQTTDNKQKAISPTENKEKMSRTFPHNVYLINNGGCAYKDSIIVDSIGNNLFVDKKGNIYFKTYDRSDGNSKLPVLISRFYNGCEGDSTYDLSVNIDSKSFIDLGMGYYADKTKVIIHNLMSDGGNISIIEEADRKSFKALPNSLYAIDKKHVYYKGSIIDKADSKTFKGIYKYTQTDTICFYGQDSKNCFDGGTICTKDQIDDYLKE